MFIFIFILKMVGGYWMEVDGSSFFYYGWDDGINGCFLLCWRMVVDRLDIIILGRGGYYLLVWWE